MDEQAIISEYLASPQNSRCRIVAVNSLRHLYMDTIVFDVKDDETYMAVYQRVMQFIESRYPILSWEVQRQIAKKKRRQGRRVAIEQEQQVSVHI